MRLYRTLTEGIKTELISGGKVIVVYGARQTGKTTLAHDLLSGLEGKILKVNADETRYVDVLSSQDFQKMELLIGGYDVLFIDEAQRIPQVGLNLKIIHDNLPNLKILVTGSSSFELAGKIKEPLTGRTSTFSLFPMSLMELVKESNVFDLQNRIDEFMTFGMYPEILLQKSSELKEKRLRELASSYLFKDIFELSSIRNPSLITKLLQLLAFQVGSEVSIHELAQNLKVSQETINNYIHVLEQAFIVFRLSGFSRNLRKEISKKDKIYFWDLGIRNSILNNFSPIELRKDKGEMWENFMIAERKKYLAYTDDFASGYFWRTYTGAELDYVEEKNGELFAFEIKHAKAKNKAPKTWVDNYSSNYKCVLPENYWEFVML